MFLTIVDNGVPKKMRKEKLCWLLQDEAAKISSDLSRRFVRKNTIVIQPTRAESDDNIWKNETITRGDRIVVKMDQIFYIGLVLDFQKCDGASKKSRLHTNDLINLSQEQNIYFILNPLHRIDLKSMTLQPLSNISYFHQKTYLCHIKKNFSNYSCPVFKIQLKDLNEYKM